MSKSTINLGDLVHITDNNSLFKGKSGVVIMDMGKDGLIVSVLHEGGKRNVMVKKSGVQPIADDLFQGGGTMHQPVKHEYATGGGVGVIEVGDTVSYTRKYTGAKYKGDVIEIDKDGKYAKVRNTNGGIDYLPLNEISKMAKGGGIHYFGVDKETEKRAGAFSSNIYRYASADSLIKKMKIYFNKEELSKLGAGKVKLQPNSKKSFNIIASGEFDISSIKSNLENIAKKVMNIEGHFGIDFTQIKPNQIFVEFDKEPGIKVSPTTEYATGGRFDSLLSKAKSLGKKGAEKAKAFGSSRVEQAKDFAHKQKRKIALDVIDETRGRALSSNKEKDIKYARTLKLAGNLVEDFYAEGGMLDDEGNLIDINIGDTVVEFRKMSPNQPKRQIGPEGKVITIVGAMAKISYPNDYEEFIPLKHLKKVSSEYAKGGGVGDKRKKEIVDGLLKEMNYCQK